MTITRLVQPFIPSDYTCKRSVTKFRKQPQNYRFLRDGEFQKRYVEYINRFVGEIVMLLSCVMRWKKKIRQSVSEFIRESGEGVKAQVNSCVSKGAVTLTSLGPRTYGK